MFYDYYYKVDGELRRYSTSEVLNDEKVSNIFGAKKKVVLLEPVVFERTIIVDDKAQAVKEQVGFIGYVE